MLYTGAVGARNDRRSRVRSGLTEFQILLFVARACTKKIQASQVIDYGVDTEKIYVLSARYLRVGRAPMQL